MIRVIPLFSVLNDDFDAKKLRIIPFMNALTGDSANFGNMTFPFFVAFTDEEP